MKLKWERSQHMKKHFKASCVPDGAALTNEFHGEIDDLEVVDVQLPLNAFYNRFQGFGVFPRGDRLLSLVMAEHYENRIVRNVVRYDFEKGVTFRLYLEPVNG